MARKTVRINVPLGNPDELVALAESIHAKHTELKDKSPLKSLTDLDLDAFGENATEAGEQRSTAKEAERTAQEANGKAAGLIGIAPGQTQNTPNTLLFGITQIRDLLAAVNKGNEEALSGWGFDVVVGQAKSRKANGSGNGSAK
jgi:hypothetical protein